MCLFAILSEGVVRRGVTLFVVAQWCVVLFIVSLCVRVKVDSRFEGRWYVYMLMYNDI